MFCGEGLRAALEFDFQMREPRAELCDLSQNYVPVVVVGMTAGGRRASFLILVIAPLSAYLPSRDFREGCGTEGHVSSLV